MSLELDVSELSLRDCLFGSVDVTVRADVVLDAFGAPCLARRKPLWKDRPRCYLRLNWAILVVQRRIGRDWQSQGAYF